VKKVKKVKKNKKVRKKVVKKVGRLKINKRNRKRKKKMGKCEPATAGCSHEELSVKPVVRPSITGSWYRLSPVTMLPWCPRKSPGDGGERGKAPHPMKKKRRRAFSPP
jgi:hypothetical protein